VFVDTPTPFDIRFRFLGFPCAIGALFWVGTIMMSGIPLDNQDSLKQLAVWVFAVLVSILVHELGHAIAARRFGCRVTLVKLTMLGGYCSYDREPGNPWRRIGISLAGPGAGFLLAGLVKLLDLTFNLGSRLEGTHELLGSLYFDLIWINLFWGVLNLLPILPLDGGRVSETLCEINRIPSPTTRARWISVIVAGALSLFAFAYSSGSLPVSWYKSMPWWLRPSLGMGIFFAILAVINYQAIAATMTRYGGRFVSPDDDEGEEWKRR
jgi:stage IV sporulation protein FB